MATMAEKTADCMKYLDEADAQSRFENAGLPIVWKIKKTKQSKGRKEFSIVKWQGRYEWERRTVVYTWHSRPTENPVQREYSDQAWWCSCGEANCIHVMRVREWTKNNRGVR